MKSRRIVSLVPAATEIAAALGLMQDVVGVSHECDYPAEAGKPASDALPDPSRWFDERGSRRIGAPRVAR